MSTLAPLPRVAVEGYVAPGFEKVWDAFAGNFSLRRELGGACCAYYAGEKAPGDTRRSGTPGDVRHVPAAAAVDVSHDGRVPFGPGGDDSAFAPTVGHSSAPDE